MVTQEYTYAYAAVSVTDGVLDSLILPHVNGACMQLFLDEVCARHPDERIVMVLDGVWVASECFAQAGAQPAPAHTSAVLARAQSR